MAEDSGAGTEKDQEKAREMLTTEEGYVTRKKLEESVERLESEIEKEGLKVEKGRGHHKPAKIRERDKQKALLERWKSYEEKKRSLGKAGTATPKRIRMRRSCT